MASEWLDFLAKFRKTTKLKGKDVMKAAAVEYRKKKGTKGAVNVSRVAKEKKAGRADTKDFSTKKGDMKKTGKGKGKAAYSGDK